MDYRYFPDPDLPPLELNQAWIDAVAASLPELPEQKRARYASSWGLPEYDTALLTASRETAEFFENSLGAAAAVSPARAKQHANWVNGALAARLNEAGLEPGQWRITPAQLARLIDRIEDGTLSNRTAKVVFDALWDGEGDVDEIIAARGLKQISDSGELEQVVDAVLAANAAQVAEYRAGKEKAFNFLVGQAMKVTKGKANPAQLTELLKRRLGS